MCWYLNSVCKSYKGSKSIRRWANSTREFDGTSGGHIQNQYEFIVQDFRMLVLGGVFELAKSTFGIC